MEIGPARIGDVPAIRDLALRAWKAAYEDTLDEATIEDTVADWYAEDALRQALDEPGTAVLVAADGGDVRGFCHGVVRGDEGHVLRMYVDPDHWGQGIGTRLYERLRDDLLDFNVRRMRAIVLADNERGAEFYRGLGFEKSGEGEVELGDDAYREHVYATEFDDADRERAAESIEV